MFLVIFVPCNCSYRYSCCVCYVRLLFHIDSLVLLFYHCMMKAIKFRLCIIKFKCYTFCGNTRVMNYFIIYFINVIRNQLHSIALYNKV